MAFTPPVSATVNYDTIVSQTLNNTKAERYDAIFRHSAVFAWLNLAGRKEFVDGGIQIQRDVEYATNGTVAAYEGYDAIDLTPQETDTSLLDSLKEVAVDIPHHYGLALTRHASLPLRPLFCGTLPLTLGGQCSLRAPWGRC